MSDVQMHEFRSRVDRILNSKETPAGAYQRDAYGVIIMPKAQKARFSRMSVIRPLVLLYIAFTVFKSVLIYNSDQNDYAQIIANLEAGDSKSQLVAFAMAPGYFTKPVGVFVADLADHLKATQNK